MIDTIIGFLFKVAIGYGLCYIIYKTTVKFKEQIKAHELQMQVLKSIEDMYIDAIINDTINKPITPVSTDDIEPYDKTDEELIEDWNNLWGGNPPCELDVKAIREEERKEREKKGE